MTDKPDVKKLPNTNEKKSKPAKEEKKLPLPTGTEVFPAAGGKPPLMPAQAQETRQIFGHKEIGPTYSSLRPEVKQTLDKIVYQLDVCRGTLGLIEKRISNNESKLMDVMNYIRLEDIAYVSFHCLFTLCVETANLQGSGERASGLICSRAHI